MLGHTTVTALRRRAGPSPATTWSATAGRGPAHAVVIASGGYARAAVPEFAAALPTSVASVTALDVSQPCAARRGRRAGRRGVGHRCAARRGDPHLRTPRHDLGRRARTHAADLPRSRRLLVDGGCRRARRAVRRGRRPRTCTPPPLAAADRHARATFDRPQHLAGCRCPDRRSAGPDAGRRGAILRWPGEHVQVGRPQGRAAAATIRRRGGRARRCRWQARTDQNRRERREKRRPRSICRRRPSAR